MRAAVGTAAARRDATRHPYDRRSNCTTPVYVPAITNLSFLERHFLTGDILFCGSKLRHKRRMILLLCR